MRGTYIDRWFLYLLIAVIIFGVIMLTSATLPIGFERYGDSYYFLKSHIIKGLIPGCIGALLAYRYARILISIPASTYFIATIVLLALVFIPGIAADFGTTRSWIQLGPISAQPAEFAKLSFILMLSLSLVKKSVEDRQDFHKGFLPFVASFAVIAGLLIVQPDVGTLIIFSFIAISIYTALGLTAKHAVYMCSAALVAITALIAAAPYRLARFLSFLDPHSDVQGASYQLYQALLGIGSGGMLGLGLGHSRQKFLYLPEVSSDSVFAVISEELGFIISVVFIFLIVALTLRGLKLAVRTRNETASAVMTGIMAWYFGQSFVNIGAIIGLIPLTGVPLPLISHGGSATVSLLTAFGLLLALSNGEHEKDV